MADVCCIKKYFFCPTLISFFIVISTNYFGPSSLLFVAARTGPRIVGGNETHISDNPYQLSLRYNGHHFCGAVLITPTEALSAAHCFDKFGHKNVAPYSIAGGEGNMALHDQPGLSVKVKKIYVHDLYNNNTMIHDIAYLQIEPMTLTDNVATVYLHHPNSSSSLFNHQLSPNMPLTVSGWGKHGEGMELEIGMLQSVTVSLVSNEKCQILYDKKPKNPNKILDSMLCAGNADGVGGQDSCAGDSGGPLTILGDTVDEDVLVGIVSWGQGCGRPDFPGVYTRVSSYVDWIEGMRLGRGDFGKSLKNGGGAGDLIKLSHILRQLNSKLDQILRRMATP